MLEIVLFLCGDLPAVAGPTAAAGTPERRRHLREPASVKDAIEAAGIPHTEADLLLVGGSPVGFDYRVQDGDRIEVHPTPDAGCPPGTVPFPEARLQLRPLCRDRFLCDRHLGKLARLLRLLGFDTICGKDWDQDEILTLAIDQERAVLTCSRALLKRRRVWCGRLIRSRQPNAQAVEVVRRFGLAGRLGPFRRCSVCNGDLAAVPKQDVLERIPDRTRQWRDDYLLCRRCDRLYWEGTHVARLRRRIEAIAAEAEGPS